MIVGGTPYIVGAYAFAYAVLVGYGVSLWRRRKAQAQQHKQVEDL